MLKLTVPAYRVSKDVGMTTDGQYRFYGELAPWWPLISPVEEYAEEAAGFGALLNSAAIPVHDVLDVGSGGGHVAAHLKKDFAMTLLDLSAAMLEVSRERNPECDHRLGDMRSVRLGRSFDAVLVHDAVDYMTTEADLGRAIETAYVHCRPGGIAVFVPDSIAETFAEGSDHGGSDGADGRAARYLEWTWDPDPADTWVQTEYVFLLRDASGAVRLVHEAHRTGLFGRDVWLRLLADVGFEATAVIESTAEERAPRELFVGRRHTP